MTWQPIETAPCEVTILAIKMDRAGVVIPIPQVMQQRLRQPFGGGPMRREWVDFSPASEKPTDFAPTHWMPLPEPPND